MTGKAIALSLSDGLRHLKKRDAPLYYTDSLVVSAGQFGAGLPLPSARLDYEKIVAAASTLSLLFHNFT